MKGFYDCFCGILAMGVLFGIMWLAEALAPILKAFCLGF